MLRVALVGFSLCLATAASGEELKLDLPELGQADLGGGAGTRQGTLLAGRTLGTGHDAVFGQVGWPGLFISYLHGASPKVDFGGTFAFTYGIEGTTNTAAGLKLAGLIRLNMMDNGKVNAGLRFDPGLTLIFAGRGGDADVGLAVPVSLAIGVDLADALELNFGISMPMTIFFTHGTYFSWPILPGFGLQYDLDPHLAFTFDTGFGPDIIIGGGGAGTFFAFKTLFGVGYRL